MPSAVEFFHDLGDGMDVVCGADETYYIFGLGKDLLYPVAHVVEGLIEQVGLVDLAAGYLMVLTVAALEVAVCEKDVADTPAAAYRGLLPFVHTDGGHLGLEGRLAESHGRYSVDPAVSGAVVAYPR